MNEQELMQKLVMSKAIMNKTDEIKKGSLPPTSLQEFSMPSAKYNIPEEYLSEQKVNAPYLSTPNTKPVGTPSADAIKNSKLPDEIKRLMIEHPIVQPQSQQVTLSDDLIEKASRLMNPSKEQKQQPTQGQTQRQNVSEGLDYGKIQKMIESAVNKALKENGLLVESTEKSNEQFTFRVGKHIFEGKVTKIKKVS